VAVLSVSPSPRGAQWAREDAVRILRVAGAEPLDPSIGVASVRSTLVDRHLADPHLEHSIASLMQTLVETEQQAA